MTLATQTLEVIGIRRKDADTVTVELGSVQNAGPDAPPALMMYGSHVVEVTEADMPALGTAVTLTFAVQA
ncbi:MAG: hypothetical protein KY444_00745 [Gemmatimonadetes bacterium]|nr:hypothetical protein [Gemmatimonadota bacterium]